MAARKANAASAPQRNGKAEVAPTTTPNDSLPVLKVIIPTLDLATLKVQIIGKTPLITDRRGEKVMGALRDQRTGQASSGRAPIDPWMVFCDSLYWVEPSVIPARPTEQDLAAATFGFPANAFKKAAVAAITSLGKQNITKTLGVQAFQMVGEMVELASDPPRMREDFVRPGGRAGSADLRYRGEFRNWTCDLSVYFNRRALTASQVINLLNLAGVSVGVGAWRMDKGGNFGMFHVLPVQEVE